MSDAKPTGPRSVALVGPYLSGKTTLLESILFVNGAIGRKGSVQDGNTVGDSAAEAREREMSTELNVATTTYLDDTFTFLDCPGSVELLQESLNALVGVDAAVLVCEPDPDKALALAPLLSVMEEKNLPRIIFINKIDRDEVNVEAVMEALGTASNAPLVLRHAPLRNGESFSGYVDLPSDRIFAYKENAASERTDLPSTAEDDVATARYEMLEKLADFDDELMEKVLEDENPDRDEIYGNLKRDFQDGLIVPVMLGSSLLDHGVRRLLKALRHEVPSADKRASAIGVNPEAGTRAQVLKTYHTPHAGKLSVARVWSGTIKDGITLNGERVSGVFRMKGLDTDKIAEAGPGDVIGLGRMDAPQTGDTLSDERDVPALPKAVTLSPVFELAIGTEKRDDEVKLSSALNRLVDEDPSLIFEHREDTHELVLMGQGDIHLKIAMDRLKNKHALAVTTRKPRVPYKEAIRKAIQQHGRHKKQSGGHGQFGDVHLDIKPLPRGTGFQFSDRIVGGSVPKQYIPAVEAGVKDFLVRGPLGFPVVDLAVELFDGQFHAVDSSEIAFKTAARIAMSEGMPKCDPVLLEPILHVDIFVPSEFTPRANQLVSGRRGQILGFDAREGWPGWDVVSGQIPQSEMQDLIVELRSLSQGVGSYRARFDHLQALSGRLADDVIAGREAERAA